MIPDKHNDDTPDDTSDDQSTQPRGLLDQLRTLIETLSEIEEKEGGHRHESSRIDSGTTRIDYDYDVSIGLGRGGESSHEEQSSDRSRSEQRFSQQGTAEDSVHIETREGTSGSELVVVADLPGVTDDDVDIELDTDESALTLRVDDDIVERIGLDQSDLTITEMTTKNQILVIRLAQTSDINGGEST